MAKTKVTMKNGRMSFNKSLDDPKKSPNYQKKGNKGRKRPNATLNDGFTQKNSKQNIRTYAGGARYMYPDGAKGMGSMYRKGKK